MTLPLNKPDSANVSTDSQTQQAMVLFTKPPLDTQLDKQRALKLERELALYANTMDSLVRFPFTRQGVGLDATAGTVPVVGDIAGLVLACYAIYRALELGVPFQKLLPAIKLAVADLGVGFIPVVGDVADVFIRPSRKAVNIVHDHLREVHGITSEAHRDHPVMHRILEKRQAESAVWRNPVVSWFWLHIPDMLGVLVLAWIGYSIFLLAGWIGQWVS